MGAPERAVAKTPQHPRHMLLAFPPGRRSNLPGQAGGTGQNCSSLSVLVNRPACRARSISR